MSNPVIGDEGKKALEQFLLQLLTGLQNGAGWAKEQIPLVLQEKLRFEFWWACVELVFFALLAYVLWRGVSWVRLRDERDEDVLTPLIASGAVVGWAFSLAALFINLHTIIQIWLAPRLYLLEWAKTFYQAG